MLFELYRSSASERYDHVKKQVRENVRSAYDAGFEAGKTSVK
jgi:hypothetical protein